MSISVEERARDYISWRGLAVPDDIMHCDLTALGFDITDWAILLGEIQCDQRCLISWDQLSVPPSCLAEAEAALDRTVIYDNFWLMKQAIDQAWPVSQRVELAARGGYHNWPR
jgi:hypothetical protein